MIIFCLNRLGQIAGAIYNYYFNKIVNNCDISSYEFIYNGCVRLFDNWTGPGNCFFYQPDYTGSFFINFAEHGTLYKHITR